MVHPFLSARASRSESAQSSREELCRAAVLHAHSDRKSLLWKPEILLDVFLSVTEVVVNIFFWVVLLSNGGENTK